jgi:hypothetical protein
LPPSSATIEAWIFSSRRTGERVTSCGEVEPGATCVARRNVEVIVSKRRAKAARAALEDLD